MEVDRNGLEALAREECLQLLNTQALGRIGVTVNALPVVLPVNYQVFHGQVVIQTERNSRLAAATNGTVVAFEVDDIDLDGLDRWNVVITGIATEITDADLLAELRAGPLTRWVREEQDRYVSISLELLSGRRITPVTSLRRPKGESSTPTILDGADS